MSRTSGINVIIAIDTIKVGKLNTAKSIRTVACDLIIRQGNIVVGYNIKAIATTITVDGIIATFAKQRIITRTTDNSIVILTATQSIIATFASNCGTNNICIPGIDIIVPRTSVKVGKFNIAKAVCTFTRDLSIS